MSPKNVALIAAAVAVAGMGLYLFIEVNAAPAPARVTATPEPHPARLRPAERAPEPRPQPSPAAAARPTPPSESRTVHAPAPAPARELDAGPADEPDRHPDLKLERLMDLANKAYDRQDFDEAIAIAGKVLSKDPTNVRMLRVMVSANCIAGDSAIAQEYYVKLPAFDRNQMRTRCDRYGVTLEEPAR